MSPDHPCAGAGSFELSLRIELLHELEAHSQVSPSPAVTTNASLATRLLQSTPDHNTQPFPFAGLSLLRMSSRMSSHRFNMASIPQHAELIPTRTTPFSH